MSSFSIGYTAVAGLQLAKTRPLTLLYWFGLTLLVSIGGAALMFGTGAMSFYQELLKQGSEGATDPEAMFASIGRLFGVMALMIPIYLLFIATLTTAAIRAVLEPENSAFGYLRLGAAELRTLVVLVAISVIMFLVYLVVVFLAAIVGGAAAIGGAAAGGDAAGGVFAGLFTVLLILLVIVGLIWFATRMSLAVPQTFDTRSINIFGTWAITKGNTGKLFLAYLLAFLIYFGISLVGGLINVALMGGSLASLATGTAAGEAPDMAAIFGSMGPAIVVNMLISGIVAALGTAVMICPSAEAYLELANRSQREADVFA
jgi:hypothetical protein